MNYAIKFGAYYFQSGSSHKDKDFISIQLTKNIQGAVWYNSEDDANEWAEKIGGKVISFEIDVEEETENFKKLKAIQAKLFAKKQYEHDEPYIKIRSNVIQFDEMGYPLRLVITRDGDQIWIDSYEQEGDMVLKWEEEK